MCQHNYCCTFLLPYHLPEVSIGWWDWCLCSNVLTLTIVTLHNVSMNTSLLSKTALVKGTISKTPIIDKEFDTIQYYRLFISTENYSRWA